VTSEHLANMLGASLQKALAPVQEQFRAMNEALERLEQRVSAIDAHKTNAPAPASTTPQTHRSEPRESGEEQGCLVPECQADVLAKHLCETHYRIMRRTVATGGTFDPATQRPAKSRVAARSCEEDGCTEPHYAKGLCRRHYMATRSRIRAAERLGSTATTAAAQVAQPFTQNEDTINPHAPSTSPGNGDHSTSLSSPLFRESVATTSSSREALPTAEVVSRVVTQYRGGLDRVAEVLGRNKRSLMELLDRLDLMPFVTRIRQAERQRIESATLRERLDDLLFREKLLDDLGCLKDVDERARYEVKSRCASLAKSSESIEEALHLVSKDLELDDAGMKRLIWRYDLRRYFRGLKLKSESAPVRSR
jgi:hypothetical protein